MIRDEHYLKWNKRLGEKKLFHKFFVFWGIYSVVVFGLVAFYLVSLTNGARYVLTAAIAGVFAHYVICKLVHLVFVKQHPYQRLNFAPPKSWLFSLTDLKKDSFPSEHSATASAIATVFYFFHSDLGLVLFSVVILMGWARIVLGYHDIKDVLAGWILGGLSGILILYLVQLF